MNVRRLAVLTLAAAVLSGSGASATERASAAVLAPVNSFFSAARSGNIALLRKQYMPSSTIVDNHPPFIWSGENAEDAYFAAFGPFAKKVKMTDLKVSIGAAKHLHIAATTAYVVVPVTAASKVDGKPFAEAGLLAFALRKTRSGWKIA
jgi:ketosteroid isomerase-like protein